MDAHREHHKGSSDNPHREQALRAFSGIDEAADGLFLVGEDDYRPYDVRKSARVGKNLGLEPGEQLPDDVVESCYF